MKLTDTHLVLLSAAAQHADRLLVRPDAMTDSAARKLAVRLLRAGLVEQVTAGSYPPHWLMDDGGPVDIRITAAGLSAIGIADEPAGAAAEQPQPVLDPGSPPGDDAEDSAGAAAEQTGPARNPKRLPRHQPRTGTKQALILDLLHRAEGASIDDLIAATGWLPHTSRAALTGLRQKGYALRKSKGADGRTRYRIGEPDQER
jgi:hypothetical protein